MNNIFRMLINYFIKLNDLFVIYVMTLKYFWIRKQQILIGDDLEVLYIY